MKLQTTSSPHTHTHESCRHSPLSSEWHPSAPWWGPGCGLEHACLPLNLDFLEFQETHLSLSLNRNEEVTGSLSDAPQSEKTGCPGWGRFAKTETRREEREAASKAGARAAEDPPQDTRIRASQKERRRGAGTPALRERRGSGPPRGAPHCCLRSGCSWCWQCPGLALPGRRWHCHGPGLANSPWRARSHRLSALRAVASL